MCWTCNDPLYFKGIGEFNSEMEFCWWNLLYCPADLWTMDFFPSAHTWFQTNEKNLYPQWCHAMECFCGRKMVTSVWTTNEIPLRIECFILFRFSHSNSCIRCLCSVFSVHQFIFAACSTLSICGMVHKCAIHTKCPTATKLSRRW